MKFSRKFKVRDLFNFIEWIVGGYFYQIDIKDGSWLGGSSFEMAENKKGIPLKTLCGKCNEMSKGHRKPI